MSDLTKPPSTEVSTTSPAAVYLASLGNEKSRATQLHSLRRVLRVLELPSSAEDVQSFAWHSLRYEHVEVIRAKLIENNLAPATANLTLAALRRVLQVAWKLGQMDGEVMRRATDVEPIRGSRLPKGRHIEAGEMNRLFEACSTCRDRWLGSRDAALLAVLFGAGLRRSEAASINVDDVKEGVIKVIGKGNKERIVYLPPGAREAVEHWVKVRGDIPGEAALLLSGRRGYRRCRLSDGGILDALNRIAKRARVKQFSPHDLRRTHIGSLLDAGADIASVQQLVGHASPTTTSRYDRRGERAKKKSAGLLHVPYIEEEDDDSD